MATDMQIAWACGLFEGEGHISILNSHRGYRQMQLGISSTDQDVVTRFHEIVKLGKVSLRSDNGKLSKKPLWRWVVSSQADVKAILVVFMPMLGERRKARAQEVLDLIGE